MSSTSVPDEVSTPGDSPKLVAFLAFVTLVATLLIVTPWQGNLDRIGPVAHVPVPSGATNVGAATRAILTVGAWWRIEPDYSHFLVLQDRFAHRADTRLVSPMGPWGFLYRGWHPDNALLLPGIWVVLASIFWIAIWTLGRRRLRGGLLLLWFAAILFVLSAVPRDTVLLLLPVLLLMESVGGAPRSWVVHLLAVASALAALVKVSSLIIACIVLIGIAVIEIRRRRPPLQWVSFLVAFVSLYLMSGQRLSDLIWNLQWSVRLTMAFGEAWAIQDAPILIPILTFAIVGGAAVAATLLSPETDRFDRLVHAVALALICGSFAKAAFVRFDSFHAILAPSSSLSLLLYHAPLLSRWRRLPRLDPVLLVSIVSIVLAAPHCMTASELTRQVRAAVDPVGSMERSRAQFRSEMAAIRAANRLSAVRGTVDLYGIRQSIIIANSLAYRPRPVFQSFNVADDALGELNAEALRGPEAPESALFELIPLDDRYPALSDALSWPELFARYEVFGVRDTVALLYRREVPRRIIHEPLASGTVAFGQQFTVPSVDGMLWASIDLRQTVLGRLVSIAYKLPPLYMRVETADGKVADYRLVPAIARGGFVLSPQISDSSTFAAASEGMFDLLGAQRVTSITVVGQPDALYEREIAVRIEALSFEAQGGTTDSSSRSEIGGPPRAPMSTGMQSFWAGGAAFTSVGVTSQNQ